MSLDRINLRTKIAIVALIPLTLMVLLAAISLNNTRSMTETNRWVDHTHTVIRQANAILAAAVDMETGMRGFLLAGKDNFLEPYNRGRESFDQRVMDLKKTVSDNPAQVTLLGEIHTTIHEWQTNVTEPMIPCVVRSAVTRA